ncbi:MAG TPA: TFIIB-type zinc ribbon-containing protein [Nitrososphaeraceae archaeon]
MSNFCPECGGELKLDTATKNFICKSCGLFASREKIDELRDKTFRDEGNDRKKYHDDYLDWWTSSKKDKQRL